MLWKKLFISTLDFNGSNSYVGMKIRTSIDERFVMHTELKCELKCLAIEHVCWRGRSSTWKTRLLKKCPGKVFLKMRGGCSSTLYTPESLVLVIFVAMPAFWHIRAHISTETGVGSWMLWNISLSYLSGNFEGARLKLIMWQIFPCSEINALNWNIARFASFPLQCHLLKLFAEWY